MKVYLSASGRRVRGYRVGDLSAQGLFVQAPQHDLHKGAVVRALFTLPRAGNVIEIRRIPAVVARVSPGGLGLMFTRRAMSALPLAAPAPGLSGVV